MTGASTIEFRAATKKRGGSPLGEVLATAVGCPPAQNIIHAPHRPPRFLCLFRGNVRNPLARSTRLYEGPPQQGSSSHPLNPLQWTVDQALRFIDEGIAPELSAGPQFDGRHESNSVIVPPSSLAWGCGISSAYHGRAAEREVKPRARSTPSKQIESIWLHHTPQNPLQILGLVLRLCQRLVPWPLMIKNPMVRKRLHSGRSI